MTLGRTAALATAVTLLTLGVACTKGPLSRLSRPPSPHEAYVDTLRRAGLDQTALGLDWLQAAARALDQPVEIVLPFREAGYFAPDKPSAVAYRFEARRGRTLAVEAAFESLGQGRLFVDLFRATPGTPAERLTSMPADMASLALTIDEDGIYLLRIQPELLRGGRYTVVQRSLASLPFPVPGLTSRAIKSAYGADRDAGVRQHEGVDIFAPAGTPVVAVTGGIAQPSTNNLGGNVVWLQDAAARRTYYYAHLQQWALTSTSMVRAGDVLGYVGNTGNARTTPPHLHFGVYSRGAIDPLPFIELDQETPPLPAIDLALGTLARVHATRAPALRRGPAADAPAIATLERGTLVTVSAAAIGRTVRVLLPDGVVGYLPAPSLGATTPPLARRALPAGAVLRERPMDVAPAVHVVTDPVQSEVIGRFAGYDLVRSAAASGWVAAATSGG